MNYYWEGLFSPTTAVYREPEQLSTPETLQTNPTNSYGETKLAIKKNAQMVREGPSHSTCCTNVAGADLEGKLGEYHQQETRLIPIVLQVAFGKPEKIMIFGSDYDTRDGPCIRNYIHVTDLTDAYILAIQRLREGG